MNLKRFQQSIVQLIFLLVFLLDTINLSGRPANDTDPQCPFAKHFDQSNKKSQKKESKQQRKYYKKPIKTKRNHLFLGDYPGLKKKGILKFLGDLKTKHSDEKIVRLSFPFAGMFFNEYYIVFSPELAQEILNDQSGSFIKGSAAKRFKKSIAYPEGIIFMESNDRWKEIHQKYFEGPFNPRYYADRYGDIFKEQFDRLISRWQSFPTNHTFDLYTEITNYTMAVIAQAFFSYRMNAQEQTEIVPAFKFILDTIQQQEISMLNAPKTLPTQTNRRFKRTMKSLRTFYQKLIDNDPGSVTVDNQEVPTIISILKNHRDKKNNQSLTNKEIISHISTLFFAGHDTTANMITMLLYHLMDDDIYSRISSEVQQNLKGRSASRTIMGTLPSYEKLQREVLRMYPSAPIIARDTTKKVFIGDYKLSKKSTVLIPLSVINRDKDFYQNPNIFNIDRMEEGNNDYKASYTKSFIPFSVGARRCLGQWLAQAEARSFITQFVQAGLKLDLKTKGNQPIELKMVCTAIPSQTIYAQLQTSTSNNNPVIGLQEKKLTVIDMRYEDQDQTIKTFRLGLTDHNNILTYQSGDYLTLYLTTEHGETTSRSYTISSSPTQSDQWVEITVKKEDDGFASNYLHDKVTIGDALQVRLPLHDDLTLPTDHTTPLVLISGGIGITPMISITRTLNEKQWQGPIYFIHASQKQNILPFEQEIKELQKKLSSMKAYTTLTREDHVDSWDGHYGRFDDLTIKEFVGDDFKKSHFMLCGTSDMINNLKQTLIKKHNIDSNHIQSLSFGAVSSPQTRSVVLTTDQVSQHNTPDNAWIIIDNKVFDITKYLDHHPGLDVIKDYLGIDATHAFHGIPHSARAQKFLSESEKIQFIGYIKKAALH